MAEFLCDLRAPATPLPHIWEAAVGGGHSTLALRSDYQRGLKRCHEELGFERLRFHGWLLQGMGIIHLSGQERVYSFLNTDKIIDCLADFGMAPLVEFGFMPEPLASGKKTTFQVQGQCDAAGQLPRLEQVDRTDHRALARPLWARHEPVAFRGLE